MINESVLIAGYGGQGVLFAGKVLAQAALDAGLYAVFFPSYGAEIRGGTANCTVVISEREVGSPVVLKWNNLIILNRPSCERFINKGAAGANFVLNSSLIGDGVDLSGKKAVCVPLSEISRRKLNDAKFTNIVSLGVFLNLKNYFPLKYAENALEKWLKGKVNIIELNKRALNTEARLLKKPLLHREERRLAAVS